MQGLSPCARVCLFPWIACSLRNTFKYTTVYQKSQCQHTSTLQKGLLGFPVLPVLPPTAAKWSERLRGHLAIRQEGSPPSCTSCLSSITGKPKSPVYAPSPFAYGALLWYPRKCCV